jgi:hypothetical protein
LLENPKVVGLQEHLVSYLIANNLYYFHSSLVFVRNYTCHTRAVKAYNLNPAQEIILYFVLKIYEKTRKSVPEHAPIKYTSLDFMNHFEKSAKEAEEAILNAIKVPGIIGIVKEYLSENEVVTFTPLRALTSRYPAVNSLSMGNSAAASAVSADRPSVLGKRRHC